MKLLKITIAFVLLVSLQIASAQWLNIPPPVEAKNLMIFTAGVPVAGLTCPGTITKYLGYGCDGVSDNDCTVGGTEDGGNTNYTMFGDGTNWVLTTPAGANRICSIEVYVKQSQADQHLRLAVLDASRNTVCEGIAEITIVSSTGAWEGHTGSVNLKAYGGADGSACNLSGSTNYIIAVSQDGGATVVFKDTTNSTMRYVSGDYTGGFPSSVAEGSAYSGPWSTRIGLAQ